MDKLKFTGSKESICWYIRKGGIYKIQGDKITKVESIDNHYQMNPEHAKTTPE